MKARNGFGIENTELTGWVGWVFVGLRWELRE